MTEYKLIEILPKLFVGNCDDNLLYQNNIINIINVDNFKQNYHDYNTLKINTSNYNTYIHSNNILNLDFNMINDFIMQKINNNENIAICDKNNIISFIIICSFMQKYLNMTFTETISYVQRKYNIDIKTIPPILLFQLFENFSNKN
jgi:hypothetical protein